MKLWKKTGSQPFWNEIIRPSSKFLVPEGHAKVSECLEQGATEREAASEQPLHHCLQGADA